MSLETYVKGTKCWFTDDKEGWISAALTTKDVAADGKVTLTFVDDNGKVQFDPDVFSFSSFFLAMFANDTTTPCYCVPIP